MNNLDRVSVEELQYDIQTQEKEKLHQLEVLGLEECLEDVLMYNIPQTSNGNVVDKEDIMDFLIDSYPIELYSVICRLYREGVDSELSALVKKAGLMALGDLYDVDVTEEDIN